MVAKTVFDSKQKKYVRKRVFPVVVLSKKYVYRYLYKKLVVKI